jgi:adenine-specific DNA-methyltransferase
VDWANRLILGDSLLVMNSLLTREHMRGKVQVIYMDPPYGIKFASNFQPFINQRDVKDREEDLTREPEMIKAYRDTWEKGVHTYLAYLRDRLMLCRELLSETGSIFVQIGDENVHLVRSVLDDVFGRANVVSEILYRRGGFQTSQMLPNTFDYILWYAKDRSSIKFRPVYLQTPLAEWFPGQRRWVEMPDGTSESYIDGRDLPEGARVYTHRAAYSASGGETSRFEVRLGGRGFLPPGNRGWSTNPVGFGRLTAADRLMAIGNSLRFKPYYDDFPLRVLTNGWTDTVTSGFGEEKIYSVQTASQIVGRCLLMTTDPGDLVLDPTCGSGTTAYVAEQWGRRWITIDTSRVALALARQRLMTASFPMYRTMDDGNDPGRNFVYKSVQHVTLRSIAQNPRLDPDKVKGRTKPEIDAIIAANADQETLYDQPEVAKGITRVSGPFTVEAIPAPILSPHAASPIAGEPETLVDEEQVDATGVAVQNAGAYIANLVSLLRQDGVTFPGGKKMLVPDIVARAGQFLHADATTEVGTETKRVAFSFGPQYGPVTVQQVEQGLRQANRTGFDVLVFCGFAFEGTATAAIDETRSESEVQVAWAQISPDLLMRDEKGNSLLKTTVSSQLFTAFGEPDADLKRTEDGWIVSINGVDIYDPVAHTVSSAPIEKVAAWFLDTDYDGRTFCICQAFFPQTTAWDKLARALKGTIDLDKLDKYKGHESLPFEPGEHRAVAVKVIDLRGNEVMRVLRMPEEQA